MKWIMTWVTMMMSNMLWNMACDVDDYAVDDDVNDDTDYGVDDLFVCCCSFFFFFFWGGGGFTSQVNSYGHGGTVSSPNHTFSWAHTFACNRQQPFLNDSAEGR